MVRTMMTGATRVAAELSTMAESAAIKGLFSVANRGMNFLPDSRNDRFCRGALSSGDLPVSSVYFIVAFVLLGIVELDIFGRCFHQFLVFPHRQNLAFHQKNNLVVIDH